MRASRILCMALAGWLAATGAAAAVKVLDLPAFDMVYSSRTGLLYASVSGRGGERANTVTAIDPKLGQIMASVPVGLGPGFLALSDDQKVLYVTLHSGAGAVSRIDLSSFKVTQTFPAGGIPSDLAVQPGNPNVVAVSRNSSVAIFDNGVRRPNTTSFGESISQVEFSSDPGILYGYNAVTTEFGFRTIRVDSQGASVLSVARDLLSGFYMEVEYAAGLIFSTSGEVVNPVTLSRLGTFPVGDSPEIGDSVLPEPGKDRVLFLTREGISTFQLSTFSRIDSIPLPPEASERGSSLVRWGDDGLAFLTEGNQVILLSEEGFSAPPPPAGPWLSTGALPGFRAKVRINGATQGQNVPDCIAETLCVSGALAGRPEIFVKIIGPRPNGFLWTQISRFTPSKVEIWLQQEATGKINYYLLDPVPTGADNVSGLLDRRAFEP